MVSSIDTEDYDLIWSWILAHKIPIEWRIPICIKVRLVIGLKISWGVGTSLVNKEKWLYRIPRSWLLNCFSFIISSKNGQGLLSFFLFPLGLHSIHVIADFTRHGWSHIYGLPCPSTDSLDPMDHFCTFDVSKIIPKNMHYFPSVLLPWWSLSRFDSQPFLCPKNSILQCTHQW